MTAMNNRIVHTLPHTLPQTLPPCTFWGICSYQSASCAQRLGQNVTQTSHMSVCLSMGGTARAFDCCQPSAAAAAACAALRGYDTVRKVAVKRTEVGLGVPLPHYHHNVGVEGCLWILADSAKSGDSAQMIPHTAHIQVLVQRTIMGYFRRGQRGSGASHIHGTSIMSVG